MAIEIVDLSFKKWWIFPSFFVNVDQAGYVWFPEFSTKNHSKNQVNRHPSPSLSRRRLYPRILFGEPTADSPCTEEDEADLKDDFPCHGAMVFHGDIMQDGAMYPVMFVHL